MFFLVYVWIILLLYLVPSFFGTFVLYEQGWKWILKLHPLVIKPWTKCDYLGTCVTLFGVLKGWQELVSLFSLCLKGDSCTMKKYFYYMLPSFLCTNETASASSIESISNSRQQDLHCFCLLKPLLIFMNTAAPQPQPRQYTGDNFLTKWVGPLVLFYYSFVKYSSISNSH
jgi:hypothetical protein